MYIKKRLLIILFSIPILFGITYIGFYQLNLNFYLGDYNFSSNSLMANDAFRYKEIFENYNYGELLIVLLANKNLIPPTIPLYILNGNLFLIYIFFFSCLVHSLIIISKYIRNNFFLSLLIFSPVVLSNLFPASKEITAYISGLYFLIYLLNKKKRFIYYSIIFAFFTRFELILVILFLYGTLNIPFLKRNKRRVFLFSLASFSLLLKGIDLNRGVNHIEETTSNSILGISLIYELFISNGLYFIVYPIKFLHNLFKPVLIPSFNTLGAFFTFCSSFLFLVFSVILIKNKSYKINDYELIYSVLIYGMIFCAGGFIQHRYFVFLYPVFLYMAYGKFIVKKNNL
jgi:hypothetical protein